MRFSFFTYLVLGLICICSSCAYKQDQILFERKNSIPDSIIQKNIANVRNYRIKPQDILQIRNLQNIKSIVDLHPNVGNSTPLQITSTQPETFQVDDDGTIALPNLGHVPIAGLTRQEATKKIEDLYKKDVNEVLIELKITNLKVTVFGEIKNQGNYPLTKDKTTVIELIGEAGGITEKANEKDVKIIRGQTSNPLIIPVDLSDIRSIANPILLQSGDVIYIAENKRSIRADKIQTFSTTIQPALLVLSTVLLIITFVRR